MLKQDTKNRTHNQYLPGVDGLRSIAVLSVLFFHAGFDQQFSGGYVGVDIFFVISGFLITRLIVNEIELTGDFSYSNFYYRRCKRLLPALIFVIVVSFIFAFLLFTPQHLQRFGGEVIYASTSLSNFYFWNESGYFNTEANFKPLLHTWSLSVEEQFYILWPITLVLLAKRFSQVTLLFSICFAMTISFLANIVMQDGESAILTSIAPSVARWFSDGQATIFYLAPFRVFEFGVGALLVWALRKPIGQQWLLEFFMVTGLATISYAIVTFDETTTFPSYNALIPCIGTALIICSLNAKYSGLIIRNKLSIAIGLISYSIYLIHWPIIVFYKYYKVTPLSVTEQSFIVLISVGAGIAMYYCIEQPFRKHSPAKGRGSKAGFGLAATMSIILIILPAATAWANSGWPWRISELPESINAQLNDSQQFHIDNYGGEGYPPANGWVAKHPERDQVDIVLLGDSHVRHYAYGLDRLIGKQGNINIYMHSTSCLLVPEIVRITPGVNWGELCEETLNTAIDTVNKNPDSILMISHSWNFQLSVSEDTISGKSIGTYEDLIPKLDKLKERIEGHRMVIIGNVPGAGTQDVIGCFSRPSYLSISCDEILSQQEDVLPTVQGNDVLKRYASNREDVDFFNTHDAFCSDGKCFTLNDGQVLYSDQYHLSKQGSIQFVMKFRNEIMDILDVL